MTSHGAIKLLVRQRGAMGFHLIAMTLVITRNNHQCVQARLLIVALPFPFPIPSHCPFDPSALSDLPSDLPLATALVPGRADPRDSRRLCPPKGKLLLTAQSCRAKVMSSVEQYSAPFEGTMSSKSPDIAGRTILATAAPHRRAGLIDAFTGNRCLQPIDGVDQVLFEVC